MDQVYIQNVLNGSAEDFRFLIRKYKDLAFSVAVSVVKNEFEAEEVVQEAFIKAFKNLASLKDKTFFNIDYNFSYITIIRIVEPFSSQ